MISEERLLKVLRASHMSEKATLATENGNSAVFKVAVDATKREIKRAVERFFEVRVKSVNTLTIKGKVRSKGRRSDVKKAYIILKEGEKIEPLMELGNME